MMELINGLLKVGVDLQAVDEDGRSPLHCIVARSAGKFAHMANSLIENDARVDVRDGNGHLAVEKALEEEADTMAALLLRNMSCASYVIIDQSSQAN